RLRQGKQLGSQVVVEGHQLTNDLGRHPIQEAAQRGLVGKTRKAEQGKEGSVVLQDVGFVDASQARHDRIEEGQNEIRGMVVGIALGYAYPLLQQTAKSELVAKTLQQYHSPEVSQMSLAKGKTQCSQGLGHVGRTIARGFSPCTQTPLKVNFVCRAIYSPRSAKILCLAKILVPSSRFIEVKMFFRRLRRQHFPISVRSLCRSIGAL